IKWSTKTNRKKNKKKVSNDQKQKNKKSDAGNSMIGSLVFLFVWSFRMGYMPIEWKKANIVPIPKPDRDHSQCKNHRPIALLSSVDKLMERIITRRLMWWLNKKQLLHQTQAGFQSWHSTDGLRYKMRNEFQLDGRLYWIDLEGLY
ncbi:hypothetical protein RFI_00249, partial [Reticulomyxa filosa]